MASTNQMAMDKPIQGRINQSSTRETRVLETIALNSTQ